MTVKTPGDECLRKTWIKKASILLAFVVLGAIVLSVPAAATHAHSIVVFTDKKTYLGWWVDPVKNGVGYTYIGVDDAPLDVYVYTMVLSEKGTIIKGEESQLNGYVADYKRLAPGQSLTAHHNEFFGETVFGNKTLTFTDDGSLSGDIAGDGVYVAKVTLDKSKGATLVADHMVMNVTVSYPGMESNTQQVLISQFYCMNGKQSGAGHAQHTSQTGTSANCAVCHRGYEHWFENKSKTFRDDQLDIHVFKTNPPDVPLANQTTPFDSNRWNWSDDGGANDKPTFEDQVPGSRYCAFCHEVAGSATYDYGGGDRTNMADRPSCNNSNCHANTKINNTAVPAWNPATMPGVSSLTTRAAYNITKAEKHAHDTTGVDTVPCASCHRTTHSLELPNRTSTDYTDLANRCLSCHTLFNKHNSSVSCIKCHGNDTHNIRFLQQDLSYNWSTTNVVTCDNCHTNTTFSGSLGLDPPQVPYTNHSGDSDAGQKWGDYWTSDNQQAAVGGSNLIQTSTVVVSSQSVQYGTASPLSGAQTGSDGSNETLTEGLKSVPPVDDYAYVASITATLGTVSNLSFMQNASDSKNGTLTEGISGTITIRPNATASDTTGDTLGGLLYDDGASVNPDTLSAVSTTDAVYTVDQGAVMKMDKFNTSKIPSSATITGVTLHIEYGIEDGYAPATASVRWARQGAALNSTGITPDEAVLTSGWSGDTTYDLYAQGIDTVGEIVSLDIEFTSSDTGGADAVHFDYVWLEVTYTGGTQKYYEMNIQASIQVPYADSSFLEIRYYKDANETYDLYVNNGTTWNDRGNLINTTMSVLNYTLTSAEYNNGGIENNNGDVQIKFVDRNQTPNGTSQGNIYIDYIRVHYLLGNTSHQEINLYHNFTGIPKYAAQETAEYTLTVKGYVTSGEDMDVYAYDYTLNSYQLVKLKPFSTTIGWVNLSIPYNAISSSGNASILFTDANGSRYDNVADNFYLDYVAIRADNYKYLPCFYCHALLANHKKRALGNIEWVQTGASDQNLKNSTNLSGNWCANCHYNGSTAAGKYKYNGSAWSPAPPLITINNINPSNPNYGSWYNHSGDVSSNYTDAKCKECHGTANTKTTKDFPHAVEVGSSGGANCTNCHNTGGSAGSGRLVNFTAMNDSLAIHKNMNSGATTSLPAVNKKCWACHGNGGEPGSSHPTNYKTPYKCVDCHIFAAGQNFNYTPSNTLLNVTQHYWNGTNISTTVTSCYSCHNRTEMMVGSFDPDGAGTGVYSGDNGGNLSVSHYGKKRSDMVSMNTTAYCTYCHNTTTNNATFYVSDFNNTMYNHSERSSTPLCTTCHYSGRLHNSTLAKPASNDSYCSTCHGTGGTAATKDKLRHKALNCTECHANNSAGTLAGKDIHAIKYLTQSNTFATSNSSAVNCVICHQTTSVDSSLGSFSAFKIATQMRHSDNASNGSVWDGYWTNTTPQTACVYCHNSTLHNVTPLGRMLQWNQNYNLYGSIGSNVSCSDCHYRGDSNYSQMNSTFVAAGLRTPPEITNGTNWKGNSSNYYNHSLDAYDDQACKNCHGSLLSASANMSEFMHNVAIGVAGGANCTNCHNTGGTAGTGKLVNFTAINDTNAIHKNLNSGASTSLPAENKRCWACHGNGSEPASGHPSNYKIPYNCVDCHVPGAGQNLNFTPASILNVTQHYWNGTKVATSNATSCYICHNRSEMLVGSYDPDGAATVYSGANGGNNSVSHYGKRRGDMAVMDNNTYCKYCHDNQSSAFPFINNSNKTIANHSINYPSTNPACVNCHEAGRIHNSTLYKPAFALPNSSYCLTCHGSGGSATIKNFERHNSTSSTALNCTQCHLNNSKSIHPARYLQQDSTWDTSKTNAVNCTTCHQGSGLNGFSTAPITPKPMNHSTNSYSGALWNNTQSAYWTNTSQQSSCEYCHGKIALHNNSGLGNITRVKGNNAVRQALANSTWCANCHYSGATNYGGTSFSPEPPEITNASGKVPTKARDNTNFYNHSQDMATGYNDSKCKNCHDNNLDAGATTLNFSHNLAAGGGGANCTACHYTGASVQNINITAINEANAIHKDLNKDATASDNGYNNSKKCWACHSNGQEPSGHPTRYKTPYNCVDCHVQGAGQNFNYTPNNTLLNVTQHYWNGASIKTPAASSCYACHNTTGMIIAANDPDGASSNVNSGANGGNDSVSHYGKKRGDMAAQQNTTPYCDNCHNGASSFPFINSANRTISNHSLNNPATNPACKECHSGGRIHNSTLYKTSLGSTNSTYCLSCHGDNGSGGTNYTSAVTGIKEGHNNTGTACTQCHLNASSSIHPVRYLQQDNSWDTLKVNAVNCTTCHQGTGTSGFGSAPKVPSLNHSTNAYSGAMWNGSQSGFWTNTSQQSSCDYCHNKAALHNLSGLGNITKVKGSNSVKQSFAGGYWCANCHYAGTANYSGDKFNPRPPEVLNASGLVPSAARDGTQFYNHSTDLVSSWDDAKCKTCHNNNLGASATSLNFTHSLGSGGGGANCTSCHGLSGTLSDGKRINQTAMNSSLSLHKDLNKNAAASDANYSESKKCWACHGNGQEPSGHPTNYKTPYNCVYCHVSGAGQNFNYIPNNTILNVTQHYWNGTSINTSGATSCYICHNKSEMMVGITLDPDGASANINGGANGGNLSVSHYGKKRSDMAGLANTTYCNYCHNNQSSVFPFTNNSNKTIANHSMNYAATNPACRDCHEAGRLHNSTLYKPAFALPNSTYCLTCHGSGGSASIKNLEQHNSTTGLNCTQCHLNSTKSIHPVRYLRQNNTWSTSNTSAVNCTTCHQGTGMSGFASAPLVQMPIWHSNNTYSGALWNGTQPRYWDNTSQQSSCDYCHGKVALHNTSGLGKSVLVQANNSKNQSLTGGYWCANCHYKGKSSGDVASGNYNYKGDLLSPVPPEVFNLTGLVPANSSDNTPFQNHSTNIASDWSDARCKSCHGKDLPETTNSATFLHKLNKSAPEAGGPDCLGCHPSTATNPNGPPSTRRINATAFTNYSVHKDLNKNATNTTQLSDNRSKACWACHGDGNEPVKHPANYLNPKPCEYCHMSNNFNAPQVYKHYPGAVFAGSVVYDNSNPNRTCIACHNNSLVAKLNLTYGTYDTIKIKNATTAHYAVNRTLGESLEPSGAVTAALPNTRNATGSYGCNQCHAVGGSGGIYGSDYGSARAVPPNHNKMGSTGFSCQKSCHNSNPSVNITLHDSKAGINLGTSGCYASGCHSLPTTTRRKR